MQGKGFTVQNRTHQLNHEQYEFVIDALLRSAVLAGVVEEAEGKVDTATLTKMATAVRERVVECLALGQFHEADVREINVAILKSMFPRPEAK